MSFIISAMIVVVCFTDNEAKENLMSTVEAEDCLGARNGVVTRYAVSAKSCACCRSS